MLASWLDRCGGLGQACVTRFATETLVWMPTHGPAFVFEMTEDPKTKARKLTKKVFGPELDIAWVDDPKPRGPGYPARGQSYD